MSVPEPAIRMNASESPELPSKTQRKAAMQALQELGEELIELNTARLRQLDLPEILLLAIQEAQRITAHGALARQKQYVGRLMRMIDTAPIAEQLARWRGTHQEENARFHHLEKWRTRLLEQDAVLETYLHQYPHADSQQLRTLIRNARRELAANKPPRSSRALFILLRATSEQSPAS